MLTYLKDTKFMPNQNFLLVSNFWQGGFEDSLRVSLIDFAKIFLKFATIAMAIANRKILSNLVFIEKLLIADKC